LRTDRSGPRSSCAWARSNGTARFNAPEGS
jgi:hypothetical protein